MNARANTSNEYLKTRVLTAAPEELQLMLYDGAVRFSEQAREAIVRGDFEESFTLLNRARNIIIELSTSMKDEVAPEACANLRRLYLFCYDRLVHAGLEKEISAIDEALDILKHIRETWSLLIDKLKAERAGEPSVVAPTSAQDMAYALDAATQEIGATINFEG